MKIDLTYDYLVRHIVPGPQSLSWFVPIILLPIALLIPRSVLSRWQNIAIFVPVIVGSTIHAWIAMGSIDVPTMDILLWALFLLVFKDPWTEFAQLKPNAQASNTTVQHTKQQHDPKPTPGPTNNNSYTSTPYPPTLRARLPWTLNLLTSLTLSNWHISHPSHDKHQPRPPASPTRTAFLSHTLFHALLAYATLDLTSALTTTDPYFTSPSAPLTSPHPFHHLPLPSPILRPTLIALQSHALISSLLPLPSLALLPTPLSPHAQPPYFGPASALLSRGLAGFWGAYWHQTMRWVVSGPGVALAEAAGWERGSWRRRAVVVASAFACSGVVHAGVVPPEPEPVGGGRGVWGLRGCVVGFFGVQGVGVLVEDAVRGMGWGLRGWKRGVVSLGWLAGWFCVTLPLLGEVGRGLGWWRGWLVPVSFWRGLRGEGWVAWGFLRERWD
ncbi:hypothetical protein WHR41_02581 [Cladosporium halotolerans]|uniref:Wax synthase domain-containing protein n=1 Tax=Cladosporium halotolerans TaxID=1052096 RepID=A0AB34KZR9_9PEZI